MPVVACRHYPSSRETQTMIRRRRQPRRCLCLCIGPSITAEKAAHIHSSMRLHQITIMRSLLVNGKFLTIVRARFSPCIHSAHVLIAVQLNERNIFDERMPEYRLFESCATYSIIPFIKLIYSVHRRHGIHATSRTFAETSMIASISGFPALLITPTSPGYKLAPVEISLVYYHARYVAVDYASLTTDYTTPAVL
jgi:hypothetical protein